MIKYNIKTLNKYRREALTIKNEGYKVCLLCGEEKKSFVRSHSIPMFSLKSIADIGKVKGRLPFLSTSDLIEDYVENKIQYYKYGIKEAGTFKNICQGCEEIYFTKIEHEKKFYQVPWTSEQLTRNALKSLLYENHILLFYKCFHEVVQNNEKSEKDKKMLRNIIFYYNEQIKLNKNDIEFYKDLIKRSNIRGEYIPLLDIIFDKNINFAVNSVFFPMFDGNLKKLSKENNKGIFYHIIPKGKTTRVVVYYLKESTAYNNIYRDMKRIEKKHNEENVESVKLNYLLRILLTHSDRYVFNKKFFEKNRKALLDKELVEEDLSFGKLTNYRKEYLNKLLKNVII